MRESIVIQVGQCGNQIGHAFWQQLAKEHAIAPNGHLELNGESCYDKISAFFYQADDKHFIPRAILVDLEPRVTSSITKSEFGRFYNPENILTTKEGSGAGNNWVEGYLQGQRHIEQFDEMLQREAESSDSLDSIMLLHSVAGGTGSGMGSAIIEHMRDTFNKKFIIAYSVYPNMNTGESDTVVQPYNTLLTTRRLAENANATIVLDNQALHRVACECLRQESPSFDTINSLVARVMSATTSHLRYPSPIYNDMRSIFSELTPSQGLNFFATGYSPLTPALFNTNLALDQHFSTRSLVNTQPGNFPFVQKTSVLDIINRLLMPKNIMLSTLGNKKADQLNECYVSMMIMLQGQVEYTEITNAIIRLMERQSIRFGKLFNCPRVIKAPSSPYMKQQHRVSGLMIANHTSMEKLLRKIQTQYRSMKNRGAYIDRYNKADYCEIEDDFAKSDERIEFVARQYNRVSKN